MNSNKPYPVKKGGTKRKEMAKDIVEIYNTSLIRISVYATIVSNISISECRLAEMFSQGIRLINGRLLLMSNKTAK